MIFIPMLCNYLFWDWVITDCATAIGSNLSWCKQLGFDLIPPFTFKYSLSIIVGIGTFMIILLREASTASTIAENAALKPLQKVWSKKSMDKNEIRETASLTQEDLQIGSSDIEQLKSIIRLALADSAIVLIEGKINTGKSFILHQLFPGENILATKDHGINTGNVAPEAIDEWKARKGNVAIDETEWLTSIQFDSVLDSAISGKKGIVLAMCSINNYRQKIELLEKKHDIPVLAIKLIRFDSEKQKPIWLYY